MAGATETLDAPARELRNSQAVVIRWASPVLKQLEAARSSQPADVLPRQPPSAVQAPAAAPLHDSRLALRRPFPPRAGGDSAPRRRRASWSASSCLLHLIPATNPE